MIISTPVGLLNIEIQTDAVTAIKFSPGRDSGLVSPPKTALELRLSSDLMRYFAGEEVSFLNYGVSLSELTEFTRKVLCETRRIPYAERRTYGDLARLLGRPSAARAVGQALRRNPIPIIIPCHRIIGADGTLVGFSAGLELKKRLLTLEAGAGSGGVK